jgi:hypothetical protein
VHLTSRGRSVFGFGVTVALTLSVIGAWGLANAFGAGSSTRAVLAVTTTPTPHGEADADAVPARPPRVAQPTRWPAATQTAKPNTQRRTTSGTGHLVVVPGNGPVVGHGPLHRYTVEVEEGIGESGADFAEAVERTLGDMRSWGKHDSFKRVSSGSVAFTVTLASASKTNELCAPLHTGGIYSCYNSRGRSVINDDRWRHGASTYAGRLTTYRHYVISHEVGHALGHGHDYSCRSDGLAPVMMQQTKSLYGCARNPWPYPVTED